MEMMSPLPLDAEDVYLAVSPLRHLPHMCGRSSFSSASIPPLHLNSEWCNLVTYTGFLEKCEKECVAETMNFCFERLFCCTSEARIHGIVYMEWLLADTETIPCF